MQNPHQELPASINAQNQILKHMDVLCTLEIKIEGQNLDHWYIKDQRPYPNQDQYAKPKSRTPASSKAQNQDFKDMDVCCTPQNPDWSQNLELGCIKDLEQYPNQDQYAKP